MVVERLTIVRYSQTVERSKYHLLHCLSRAWLSHSMWRTLIVLSLPPAFAAGSGRGLWAKVSPSCVKFWDQLREAELHIDALTIEDGIGISASSYRHIQKFLTTVPFDDAAFCVEAAISAATSSDAALMSHVAESIAKLPHCFREMTFKSEATSGGNGTLSGCTHLLGQCVGSNEVLV